MSQSLRLSGTICLVLGLLVVLSLVSGCAMGKKGPKDPVEELENQWSVFDFHFGDNWEIAESGWFTLRTPTFVDEYYRILQEKTEVSEEEIAKEKEIADQYLVVQASLEYLDKKYLEKGTWEFKLKDDLENTYEPLSVEASPISKGEEVTTGYESFQPVTVTKKRGDVTVESITPSFYIPKEAHNWCRTYVLYFPKNQPGSEVPILNENTEWLEIKAKNGRKNLSGKWKIKKILGGE